MCIFCHKPSFSLFHLLVATTCRFYFTVSSKTAIKVLTFGRIFNRSSFFFFFSFDCSYRLPVHRNRGVKSRRPIVTDNAWPDRSYPRHSESTNAALGTVRKCHVRRTTRSTTLVPGTRRKKIKKTVYIIINDRICTTCIESILNIIILCLTARGPERYAINVPSEHIN